MPKILRYLSWIITIPIAALAISFAVSNRDSVVLTIWPLPFSIAVPLYLAVLGTFVLGFLVGGVVAWANQHRYRRDARRHAKRLRELSAEVKRYRERDARVREEAARAEEAARRHAAATASAEAARLERPAEPAVPAIR